MVKGQTSKRPLDPLDHLISPLPRVDPWIARSERRSYVPGCTGRTGGEEREPLMHTLAEVEDRFSRGIHSLCRR